MGSTVVTQAGGVNALQSSSSYFGQIIGQCGAGARNASVKSLISKSKHRIYQDSNTLDLRFPNWVFSAGSQVGNGADTVISAAIEYPNGSGILTQCTWNGGQTSCTIVDGGQSGKMDPVFIGLKEGDFLMVHVLQNNANGCITSSGQDTASGEQAFFSGTLNSITDITSTISTYTAGNTGGTTSSTIAFRPVLGLGYTTKRSHLGAYTDSRDAFAGSVGDSYVGYTTDLGRMGRFFGQFAAYSMFGVGGDTAALAVSGTRPWTTYAAQFFTDFHVSEGYNDKSGAVADATIYANQKTLLARAPATIKNSWLWTQDNKTTSTDSWATGTNQTISVSCSGLNTLMLAGSSGAARYQTVDAQSLNQPSGKYKFNGVASNDTADGIHGTAVSNIELAGQLLALYKTQMQTGTEREPIVPHADYRFPHTLIYQESGADFSNGNSTATTGQVAFTLPPPKTGRGLDYTFTVRSTNGIQIIAPANTTLRNGSAVSAVAGTWTSSTIGDSITFKAMSLTEYCAISSVGSGGVLT